MGDEKRRFPRIRSMNIVVDKGRVFRTLDLSREGMLLEMDPPAQVGTRLHVDLALGEDVVDVEGEVKRHVPQPDGKIAVGILFGKLSPKTDRTIRDYLLKKRG